MPHPRPIQTTPKAEKDPAQLVIIFKFRVFRVFRGFLRTVRLWHAGSELGFRPSDFLHLSPPCPRAISYSQERNEDGSQRVI